MRIGTLSPAEHRLVRWNKQIKLKTIIRKQTASILLLSYGIILRLRRWVSALFISARWREDYGEKLARYATAHIDHIGYLVYLMKIIISFFIIFYKNVNTQKKIIKYSRYRIIFRPTMYLFIYFVSNNMTLYLVTMFYFIDETEKVVTIRKSSIQLAYINRRKKSIFRKPYRDFFFLYFLVAYM